MLLKANLHFHTKDDPQDKIEYSFYEAIDLAAKYNYKVIALTLHKKFGYTDEYSQYAHKKGILLIPGIELTIMKKHVLVLNCKKDIESVITFESLAAYKERHPDIFIIAPHPYHLQSFCLGKRLLQHIDLFDAIEHSWFFSDYFNPNLKAGSVAKTNGLPFIATSDTHFLEYADAGYCKIECQESSISSILESLRVGKFQNYINPRKTPDLIRIYAKYFILL